VTIVFTFPGQGSQHKGMGMELFDQVPQFKAVEKEADTLLGYSLKALCLDDPDNRLSQTQFTQPCLYTVNMLHYFKRIADGGAPPAYLAGHSLGEYNALLAAGAFDFMTGLALVKKRGELMMRAKNGGMAAVIGLNSDRIAEFLEEYRFDSLDIANYNSPSQTVVAGPLLEIERATGILNDLPGCRCIPLPVSAAFHSRYMNEVSEAFAEFLDPFEFDEIRIPVISNVTGRPYPMGAGSQGIKALLVKQISHSVKWTESIRYLMGKGASVFEEIGPGIVLSRLNQQIQKETLPLIIDDEKDDPDSTSGTAGITAKKSDNGGATRSDVDSLSWRVSEKHGRPAERKVTPTSLGDPTFKKDYGIKYAYVAGSMYKGIASKEMVIAMGKAGLIGFLGTGGLRLEKIASAIQEIQAALNDGQPYGMNLLCDLSRPQLEEQIVALYLKYGVRKIEAAAYMQVTSPLVKYRLTGVRRAADGSIVCPNRILAKVSRPEVAAAFMEPAPTKLLEKLVADGQLSEMEAELGKSIPMAQDICVEADSGGHTDRGVAYVLMPAMLSLRDEIMSQYAYESPIRVGAAGGIGTPEAAAAAFTLGADFILTGSINQCTVEAGISEAVKDMLQEMDVQDTAYAPAGDMFELGAKVQVLKRGLFFPARANKLYELYQKYDSLEQIDEKTKNQIQEKYFKRSFEQVWEETRNYYLKDYPQEIEKAEKHPKHKMALIFKWYFVHATRLAMKGSEVQKVDYQVHCGPALGAFNRWVRGTELESWRHRRVVDLAERIMQGTADLLDRRFAAFTAEEVQ
jgi:trans-AT polyketide synthase/acyltransferase/oxidoreductase domain-containing protein